MGAIRNICGSMMMWWASFKADGTAHYRTARPTCQEYANVACVAARNDKNVERAGVLVLWLHARPVSHQVLWVVEKRSAQERRLRIYDAINGRYVVDINTMGQPLIAYEGPAMAWNAHPESKEKRADDIFAKIIARQWDWKVGVRDGP